MTEDSPLLGGIASDTTFLCVKDPLAAVTKLIPFFFESVPLPVGWSEKADIHASATIGENVTIGAFVSIGAFATIEDGVTLHPHAVIYPRARVGRGSIVHSNATIREECIIGEDSVIQNGAVIGADGFGYFPDSTASLVPVPQVGSVVLGNRVDVGANSCIDRGTLGNTKIALGTKIDNLVQIGHNADIGHHSVICGQAGIAGSVVLGNRVMLGGNVGISDHVKVADGCKFAAKTGVTTDIDRPGVYGGYPALPLRKWHRCMAVLRDLPDLLKKDQVEHSRMAVSDGAD